MKKVNIITLFVVVVIFFIAGYKLFLNDISEKFELINKDVSLNNIKSIMDVELEENENVEEIPLGYKDNKVYILKYIYDDVQKKIGKYNKQIYEIDENGTVNETEINIPDEFCVGNYLSIYGNYIFCGGSYFDWTTGEKTLLFTDEKEYLTSAVSGNKDYILYEKNENEEEKYYLVNLQNKDIYEYSVVGNTKDKIKDVFYDKDTSQFYGINHENNLVKLKLEDNNFTTEIYDNTANLNYSKDDVSEEKKYICSNNGDVYFSTLKAGETSSGINISRYCLRDKYVEDIDNIEVCGYDKYDSDCLLVKKKEDEEGKIYFAKFKNSSMDILMEIPKTYDNGNNITIRMSDGANLLVNEINYDSNNKKVDFKYSVYDLKEYFNDNEYVLNNDGTWTGKENESLTLKSVYKNIDDSQKENKEVVNNKNIDPPKQEFVEKNEVKNNNVQDIIETKNNKVEENYDYREHDPSWKKGNGDWYYFDNKDQKVTSGWIQNNGKWYYFDENGVMQKNALVIEHGCEFYIDENGVLITSNDNNEKYLKDKSKEDPVDDKVIYRKKQINEENKDEQKDGEKEDNKKDDIDSKDTDSNEIKDKEKVDDKEEN